MRKTRDRLENKTSGHIKIREEEEYIKTCSSRTHFELFRKTFVQVFFMEHAYNLSLT